MATGGMGDVLAGLIGALVGSGLESHGRQYPWCCRRMQEPEILAWERYGVGLDSNRRCGWAWALRYRATTSSA